MNNDETEDSLLMRMMVSANNSAIEIWRIRGQALASVLSGIVSVTTSSSSSDSEIRAIALPDNTGCVQ